MVTFVIADKDAAILLLTIVQCLTFVIADKDASMLHVIVITLFPGTSASTQEKTFQLMIKMLLNFASYPQCVDHTSICVNCSCILIFKCVK